MTMPRSLVCSGDGGIGVRDLRGEVIPTSSGAGAWTHGICQREARVRWRLEFYSERQQILAHYRVEAPTPATALVLGRRRVLDEYPPTPAGRPRSLFDRAQPVAGQHADAWVLYRIQRDE
jgi:hypothetical protein